MEGENSKKEEEAPGRPSASVHLHPVAISQKVVNQGGKGAAWPKV